MIPLLGPDVSSWQGMSVVWEEVAAQGATFAWTKGSEGVAYRDPTLPGNWSGMKSAGLLRGCYHFARADQGNAPEAEADLFLSQIGHSLEPGDRVALDMEVGNGDLSAWALSWLRHVEQATGVLPWVYTGHWWSEGRLTDPALARYPLWASLYGPQAPVPFAPWSAVSMWQFSETYWWNGVGRADASYFFGELADLAKIGKAGPPPPPPPSDPAGPNFVVAVPGGDGMYLRWSPRLDAGHSDFVKNGQRLTATNALQPSRTTHWQAVSNPGGTGGYAYLPNLAAAS